MGSQRNTDREKDGGAAGRTGPPGTRMRAAAARRAFGLEGRRRRDDGKKTR
jgi:hypothetical protein